MELLIVAIFVVPLLIWAAMQGKKVEEQTNQAWRQAADELSGSFVPADSGLFNAKSRRVVANVDGIDVTADHYSATSGENQTTTYTRLRANARAPAGFSLRVSRATALSGLARVLGFQDIEIGDRPFDSDYVVKTNDPGTATLWLNRSVRKRIHMVQRYAFELEDGLAKAEAAHLETNANDLVKAVRAVAAFADGRQRLLRAWGEVARKHKGSVKRRKARWATLEFELDGVAITIDTTSDANGHYTFCSAQVVGAALEPFALVNIGANAEGERFDDLPDYVLRRGNPDVVSTHVDEHMRAAIAEFSPWEVRAADGEVVVTWSGICVDADELERASALAAMLASGTARGPYR